MKIRRFIAVIAAVPLILAPGLAGAIAYMTADDGKPSICYGDTVNGRPAMLVRQKSSESTRVIEQTRHALRGPVCGTRDRP